VWISGFETRVNVPRGAFQGVRQGLIESKNSPFCVLFLFFKQTSSLGIRWEYRGCLARTVQICWGQGIVPGRGARVRGRCVPHA